MRESIDHKVKIVREGITTRVRLNGRVEYAAWCDMGKSFLGIKYSERRFVGIQDFCYDSVVNRYALYPSTHYKNWFDTKESAKVALKLAIDSYILTYERNKVISCNNEILS